MVQGLMVVVLVVIATSNVLSGRKEENQRLSGQELYATELEQSQHKV